MFFLRKSIIVEFLFYKKFESRLYTDPDFIFLLRNESNGPPAIHFKYARSNYIQDFIGSIWSIYDTNSIDYKNNMLQGYVYNHKLINILLLMISTYSGVSDKIHIIAKSFCNDLFINQKYKHILQIYDMIEPEKLNILLEMSKSELSDSYRALSVSMEGDDIMQDVQQETSGLILEQFRYRMNHLS